MVEAITPEELADKQDADEEFVLLDTRPEESFESWHIQGAVNFPFGPDESLSEDGASAVESMLDGNDEILTVCAKGISSAHFVDELEKHGFEDVKVVEGGMEEWSQVYEHVPIETDGDAEIVQIQRRAKGCLGYLVGSAGEAAAIDVSRHIDEFRDAAAARGYDITHVLDTHIHADHISGGRRLADEIGVPYHLSERARKRGVEYEYDALGRNDVVRVGDTDIKAVYTPGHTSEITSYLVNDEAVLTGDTLFVDSIGRTELEFGEEGAGKGAEMQYDSLHKVLMSEPDSVVVLPGHVTVTEDGRFAHGSPGQPIQATVGDLRRELDVLQLPEDEFVARLTETVPEKPPNYETVIAVNRGLDEPDDEGEATELELGPNRCSAP
ncbi:rhodanese [Haladaptatus sp. W1]|uniref:MBL fold metallo-hydrolase n=1 Tax=Haladaptatus sp. W1 TaxID=1897478 RepID=UPI0008499583|nr:rhodanese-like domain-containing protein [Haladaptatus sp. W1]ODR82608.1 rhodanese [Haladaptatus sp. W1]